jgi:ribose transport system substrate-binding protein
MKKHLTLMILLLIALALVGCQGAAQEEAQEAAQEPAQEAAPETGQETTQTEGDYTIGVVLKSFSNPFWLMAKTAAEAKAEELGVEAIVLGTTEEGDYNEQVAHIEDLVTRGADLIVVVPAEASALVPAVEAAVDAGVPVINLDSPIETDKVISFIGSDNVEGGNMAGQFIADQLGGEGSVAVLRGRLGNPVELQRYEGFTGALADHAGIELVAEGVANWEADEGYTVMEDFLTANPEIQAVFAESDRMALGAASAAEAAGREDIVIVGLDGIVEALRGVRDGDLAADVAQRPDLMGEYAISHGLEYLQTGEIDEVITTPMTLALKDNVAPLIESWEALGFTEAGAEEAAAEDYTIGIVLKSFSNPFWMMAKTAAEAEAERQGVEAIVLGTTEEGDYNEQVAHIEDLVTRGADLIVVVPAEASALVPAVEAAVDAGVPVINLDSPIETDKVISFIGSDNVEGGRMAGDFVAEQLGGEGEVAVLRGRLGNPVELQRYTGFTEAIATYPGLTLATEGVANWEADEGYTVMEDFLTSHPDIKAVFAESDRMALGAASAAEAAGREDIVIVGLDGIVEALRAVKEGSLTADVAQRPDLMGEYAIKYGVEYLKTGEIDEVITTPMTLALPDNTQPLIDAWEELGA